MKRCPTCQRTYTDASLNFCLEDGTPLLSEAAQAPPPVETYHQPAPLLNQMDPTVQPRQWSPMPVMPPQRKSNAVWWVLGGIVAVGIVAVGALVMILALASMGSNSNGNENLRNANLRNVNR